MNEIPNREIIRAYENTIDTFCAEMGFSPSNPNVVVMPEARRLEAAMKYVMQEAESITETLFTSGTKLNRKFLLRANKTHRSKNQTPISVDVGFCPYALEADPEHPLFTSGSTGVLLREAAERAFHQSVYIHTQHHNTIDVPFKYIPVDEVRDGEHNIHHYEV